MPADISRRRFDPGNDFAAVLLQQGRVLLDADWNEAAELLDRRLRVETTDIIGRAVVPRETPDGFEIGIANGVLTIGPGRMYVHGLLAENHGGPPRVWNPVPAELPGTTPIPFDQQPYLPDPETNPPPREGGPYLVYLDVWQREATHLEDPGLVESAVGVPATTRWQTAWRVRALTNVRNITCATSDAEVPGWLDVIRPSDGRLTTGTIAVPPDDNPCLIPPAGGYKGLENRLYRVEIHDINANGAATFKWARHNASVAAAVREINGSDLVVDLVGRDADLRFDIGDWVEVTDDARELAGRPGEMRRVADIEDATRTITLDAPLPAGAFADLAARHARVVRWDQSGQVRDTNGNVHVDLSAAGSPGVIPVPLGGLGVILEDGIQVTFSLAAAGGRFRPGDYWVFAARTADASVEVLTNAPPRGVHHHYARLAVVTFPNTVRDCRVFWPPEFGEEGCDCTVCVSPESHNGGTLTIQQAVDQVRATGGTVCLGAGVYRLPDDPIRVERAQSVRVRGQGWRTVLVHTGGGPAVVVRGTIGLTLEHLTVLSARGNGGAVDVGVENSADVVIQECYFLQLGRGDRPRAAIGLGGVLLRTRIRGNVVFAGIGVINVPAAGPIDAIAQLPRPLMTLGLSVEDNQFDCDQFGVRLAGAAVHLGDTTVGGNQVVGGRDGGLVATGMVGGTWGGSRLDVVRNTIRATGPGIIVGTDDARVDGNDIGPAAGGPSGDGIVIAPGTREGPVDRLQVTNNRVQRVAGSGIHILTAVRSGFIKQNQIEGTAGGGIVMDEDASADLLVVENNQLLRVADLDAAASEGVPLLAGIHLVRVRDAVVAGNALRDIGPRASLARWLAGIQLTSCTRARVAGNRVTNLGPPSAQLREADGIDVLNVLESAEVVDNVVRRHDEPPPDGTDNSFWRGVRVGRIVIVEAGGNADRPGVAVVPLGRSRLVRLRAVEVFLTPTRAVVRAVTPEVALVRGNVVAGYGLAPAVEVFAPDRVQMTDNRATLLRLVNDPVVRVLTRATAVVGNNTAEGGRDGQVVIDLRVDPKRVTAVGNVADGAIQLNGGGLPAPWKPLNLENV
ncbi:MAG: right-handed parallel beta-helix repeat-containing protein [Gemmataceae bacterium]|nr:right-handed parallel beta-helix repeat-containing protein [Gemmataceae bacterium]